MSVLLEAGLTYNADNAKPRVLSKSDVFELVTTAGWRGQSGENSASYATNIVGAESSNRTDAVSDNPAGGKNIGLFQIWEKNVSHPEYLYDSTYNANVARRMFVADGYTFKTHWDARTIAKANSTDTITGPSDEATPDNTLGLNSLANMFQFITKLGDASTWFRLGKGALGFVLVVAGVFAIVFIVATKTNPAVRKARSLTS